MKVNRAIRPEAIRSASTRTSGRGLSQTERSDVSDRIDNRDQQGGAGDQTGDVHWQEKSSGQLTLLNAAIIDETHIGRHCTGRLMPPRLHPAPETRLRRCRVCRTGGLPLPGSRSGSTGESFPAVRCGRCGHRTGGSARTVSRRPCARSWHGSWPCPLVFRSSRCLMPVPVAQLRLSLIHI